MYIIGGDVYAKGGVMFFLYKKEQLLRVENRSFIGVHTTTYRYLFKIVKNYYLECTWKLYILLFKVNNKLSKS